jgi:flagellar basal-body rod modification protein FlgD
MVTAVTNVPTTTNTTPTASENAGVSLAKNFDTFLTLLTTQLKNQDPTSPMDSKEFTNQLVMFSQVEQSINQNKNLEKLIALVGSQQSSNLVNYIGKQIDINSNKGNLTSSTPASWYYTLPSTASAGELRVLDSTGKVVHTAALEKNSGEHSFVWDGTLAGGNKATPGEYRLEVVAKDATGGNMTATIKTRGLVESIERVDGTDFLVVGGKKYAASDVLALRAATEAPGLPQDNGSYVNYIGKEVEFYGSNSVFQGGDASWSYGVASGASTVSIKVYDSNNNLVHSATGDPAKGRHDFNWNGVKTDGTTATQGEIYKITVEAKSASDTAVGVDVLSKGTVDSVAFENMQAMFSIGGLGVPPSWVVAVH